MNVNYRYGPTELRYLLDNSDARGRSCTRPEFASDGGAGRAGCIDARPSGPLLLEPGDALRARARPRRRRRPAWTPRTPTGDDLIFLYTGGTTGMPKGVMWRNDDLYVALWASVAPGTEPPDPFAAARAGKRAATAAARRAR